MRRNIAKVVEGCWYRRLKVIPGSCSRYWESEFVLDVPIDMVTEEGKLYGLEVFEFETLTREEGRKEGGGKKGEGMRNER